MSDENRRVVQLPAAPYVHPNAPQGAVDQAAVFNAARNARKTSNQLPKTTAPVAGGPGPQIPHLAGGPQRGGTMAQQAAAEREPEPQYRQAPGHTPSGFVEAAAPSQQVMGANQAPTSPAQLGILPVDELPQAAMQDPNFIQGQGCMFAANQPQMALKYGVVRRGQHITPQQLLSPRKQSGQPGQLSEKSVRDLEELQALQRRQEKSVTQSEDSAPTAMGTAAGNVGTPTLTAENRRELERAVESLDEFDFDRWRQSMMKDVLNNETQKKIIESRLKPMDIGDLVTQGYVIQRVDIIPGKLWVDFKMLDGETDLALKRLIMEDSKSVEVSDRYFLDKFGLMSIAAVLHKVNDKPYADFTDANGDFDDAKFRDKFRKVLKLPMPMLTSLGANALWFDIRVRKLFVSENLGNG